MPYFPKDEMLEELRNKLDMLEYEPKVQHYNAVVDTLEYIDKQAEELIITYEEDTYE